MRTALLLAILLAGSGSAATAQPGGPPPGARAPTSGALFISPSGEPFRGSDGLGAWFSGADADQDGALVPAELRADALRFFRRLDGNTDGVVDGFEVQHYENEIAPEINQLAIDGELPGGRGPGLRAARGRGQMQMGRQGAARYGLLNTPHPVRAGDLDVDGRVTEAEWSRAAARRFDLLDREKAGRLTLAGLRSPERRPRSKS
jgi:hypothetical protein